MKRLTARVVDARVDRGVPTTDGGRRTADDSKWPASCKRRGAFPSELSAEAGRIGLGQKPVLDSDPRSSRLPLHPPSLADALRPFTRAVVLTAPGGPVSGQVLAAISDSAVPSELIGHPLVAMAELTRLERDAMTGGGGERTVLVVADRDPSDSMSAFEQVDDLKPLFEVVRERLSRVAIYVFADGLPIEICKGRASEPIRVEHADPVAVARRGAAPAPPRLRIADPGEQPRPPSGFAKSALDADEPDDQVPSDTAAQEAVTREELEMLLERFEDQPDRGDREDRRGHPGGGGRR